MQLMAQDAPAANRCAYGGLHALPAWQSLVSWAIFAASQTECTACYFPTPKYTCSLKSLISTLPACPLMPSHSSTNDALETEAELMIWGSCCQNRALT